jgi:hypothetical protein
MRRRRNKALVMPQHVPSQQAPSCGYMVRGGGYMVRGGGYMVRGGGYMVREGG